MKMTDDQLRVVLLSKVRFAYKIYKDLLREHDNKSYPIADYLEIDIKMESVRMLIVNYLVALMGNKNNDKVSLYWVPQFKDRVAEFYEQNTEEMKILYWMRDKVFSL